jgi:hypothetical protein
MFLKGWAKERGEGDSSVLDSDNKSTAHRSGLFEEKLSYLLTYLTVNK